MEFYELGRCVENSEDILPLTASLISACQQNPYVEFIELREIADGSNRTEVIVIEVGDSTIRMNNPGQIKRREKFAITVDLQSSIPVIFRALRKDFPTMAHMYYVPHNTPKALCLYNVNWSTVEHHWTPEMFIQRLFWWLRESSELRLHRNDQPLEPLFYQSSYEVILPANFMEVFCRNGLCLTLEWVNYESNSHKILRAKVTKDTGNKEFFEGDFKCVKFFADPVESNSISNYPSTLAELSEKLGAEKFDRELYNSIYNLVPENGITAKQSGVERLFILVCIPRHLNGEFHRYDVIGYFLNVSFFELAKDFGVISHYAQNNKWHKIKLIGGVAVEDISSSIWKRHHLLPVEIRNSLNSEFARNISGIDASNACFNGIIAGVGALGGLLGQIWARGAWGQWCFVDPDYLNPHNLARHVGYDYMLGRPKAVVLQALTNDIYPHAETHSALHCSITDQNNELIMALEKASILVDVTASYNVPRELSVREDVPRVASLFLTPSGSSCVLLMEDSHRYLRAADIEAQYYRAILNSEWGNIHLTNHQGDIWVGGGCRDISVKLADDRLHLYAGVLAKQLRRRVDIQEAQACVWCVEEVTDAISSHEIKLYPVTRDIKSEWVVIYDEGLINKIRSIRLNALPCETGGILLGIVDTKSRTLHLVDALLPPNDSIASPVNFTRGIEGLSGALSSVHERTAGIVDYVGEWHSHPNGCSASPSSDDNQLITRLAETMRHDGLPVLMLIVSDTEISCTII
ncbi:Mov34/MPN/PAD-1 family protein [Shewanella sp. SM34]|uniref:Mov34/MPN/PAD-1 family protein n=1 Tax=unclassified Shewanella TaxID=196818 RepID=UPI0021D8D90E|nr:MULTISPECIES: Mov34/MPN/PAD-1 family protein [unclassified Shewanella]MCU8058409.1 Mov34/MPN/PAD-1 family protein [Shewanella sp. SM35]MCU8067361.1 Mov34/MPN/PAD-1 family protein [Shewanella sp. SM34]